MTGCQVVFLKLKNNGCINGDFVDFDCIFRGVVDWVFFIGIHDGLMGNGDLDVIDSQCFMGGIVKNVPSRPR